MASDGARKSRAHSSAGERSLHTGEVQGSIPCAPTRIFNEIKCISGRHTAARQKNTPGNSLTVTTSSFGRAIAKSNHSNTRTNNKAEPKIWFCVGWYGQVFLIPFSPRPGI